MIRSLAAVLLAAAAPAPAQEFEIPAEWRQATEPFKIADDVYFVGSAGLSAFLVTSRAGHILIDGGLPETAPQILTGIERLGFRPEDVKVLLINHGHFDHAGGLAELQRRTGARLLVAKADALAITEGRMAARPEQPSVPPARVDGTLRDGQVVRVGLRRLVTHLTPGHTPGTTSWTMSTTAGGRRVTVMFAGSLSVAGLPIAGPRAEPGVVERFRETFAQLQTTPADVFLTFHPSGFDMARKRARAASTGDLSAFIDPTELQRRVRAAERAFDDELARQTVAGGPAQ